MAIRWNIRRVGLLGKCKSGRSAFSLRRGKRFSEALVMAYYRARGVNTYLARNLQHHVRACTQRRSRHLQFFYAGLRGDPLNDLRRWQPDRSFCYVDDLIEGILRLSNQRNTCP